MTDSDDTAKEVHPIVFAHEDRRDGVFDLMRSGEGIPRDWRPEPDLPKESAPVSVESSLSAPAEQPKTTTTATAVRPRVAPSAKSAPAEKVSNAPEPDLF